VLPPKMTNLPPKIGFMKISASFLPWDERLWPGGVLEGSTNPFVLFDPVLEHYE